MCICVYVYVYVYVYVCVCVYVFVCVRFGDLDEKDTKKYFEKFVEKYNSGSLPDKMYKGIAFRSETVRDCVCECCVSARADVCTCGRRKMWVCMRGICVYVRTCIVRPLSLPLTHTHSRAHTASSTSQHAPATSGVLPRYTARLGFNIDTQCVHKMCMRAHL